MPALIEFNSRPQTSPSSVASCFSRHLKESPTAFGIHPGNAQAAEQPQRHERLKRHGASFSCTTALPAKLPSPDSPPSTADPTPPPTFAGTPDCLNRLRSRRWYSFTIEPSTAQASTVHSFSCGKISGKTKRPKTNNILRAQCESASWHSINFPMTNNAPTRISRACDGCRVRKVRCNGDHPCSQCAHLDLPCVFPPAPGKRKPPVRGRLVEQLRRSGGEMSSTPPSASASPEMGNFPLPPLSGALDIDLPEKFFGSETASSPLGVSDGYSMAFFLGYLQDYESVVYPFNPAVTPSEAREAIDNMYNSSEDAAFVYAFTAVTINLTCTSWTQRGDLVAQLKDLLHRCMRSHRLTDLPHDDNGSRILSPLSVSVKRIMTCLFMEVSLMAFKRYDRAFSMLREAISMVSTLDVHRHTQEEPHDLLPMEVAKRQRVYWEVYIHERFLTLVSGYPSILPPLEAGLPQSDGDVPPSVDIGFRCLIKLFFVMDEPFVSHFRRWNTSSPTNPFKKGQVTAQWIEQKHSELDKNETECNREEGDLVVRTGQGFSELQHCDIFITRVWMRTLLWQLAITESLLSSSPQLDQHEGLSMDFPAQRLSAQLRNLVSRLKNIESIGTHGSGILQKLFDITSTVAEVLALPTTGNQLQHDVLTQAEDLVYLVDFLFKFERIQQSQRNYLRLKLNLLQEKFPFLSLHQFASSSPAQF